MTSRIASSISDINVIATLLDFPQLRFIMAMHACNLALSGATHVTALRTDASFAYSSKSRGGAVTTTGSTGGYPLPDGTPVRIVTNGPPRATRASMLNKPGEFMRY